MISQESILSFLELETHDHIWHFSIPVGVPDVPYWCAIHYGGIFFRKLVEQDEWEIVQGHCSFTIHVTSW